MMITDSNTYFACSMFSTGQGGTDYSNKIVMWSAKGEQDRCPAVPVEYSVPIRTVTGPMKPGSRKEVDQPHVKTSGSRERREDRGRGRGRVTGANTVPMTSTVGSKATERGATTDINDYIPIIPNDDCQRVDEHIYEPLTHPKPVKPCVQDSGGTASHYDDVK